ncbi:MAG: bifunctional riboflavin kinase/FAD synthetase [Ruminococcus sp.]|jgi:riboflavin kinase/FMN adenylyltransferase|nr:bifunctional riboflavin kinase/FAD synthetase [Ruminococcus sp.]
MIIALGLFDGLHIGHREVISYADAVYTFNINTVKFKRNEPLEFIYNEDFKRRLLENAGISEIVSQNFDDIKNLSPMDFINMLKYYSTRNIEGIEKIRAVVGTDYRFGKDAAGNVFLLQKFIDTIIVPPKKINGIVVSSTEIKKFLISGDIKNANLFLGADYTVSGEVMKGRQFGRTINFPTLNQYFTPSQVVPKYGVYKSYTCGRKSITNIGIRPTFDLGNIPVSETHILNFDGDLYGKIIDVKLTEFIREEKKFTGIDELKNTIKTDVDSIQ